MDDDPLDQIHKSMTVTAAFMALDGDYPLYQMACRYGIVFW